MKLMQRRMVITWAVAFIALVLAPLPVSAGDDTPTSVIERFHQDLLGVMKEADSLGVAGRYDQLTPSIRKAFDLNRMIRVATGGFWRKASPEQQADLLKAFERLSISTYAAQFDGFSGQVFKTVGEKPGPQKTVLVSTRIISPGGDPAKLTYVLKQTKGQWLIADVLLDDSISQLAVRRSEFRGVLKSRGVDGLLDVLKNKAAGLLAG